MEDVHIRDGITVPVAIPEPGSLHLKTGSSGYGGIFVDNGQGLNLVYPFQGRDPSGHFNLQPGRYVVIFRAKHATSTDLSVTRKLDIRSGGSHTLTF